MSSKNSFAVLAEIEEKPESKGSFATQLNRAINRDKFKIVPMKPKPVLRDFEVELIKNVSAAKFDSEMNRVASESEKLIDFYEDELFEMYEMFVKKTLGISFEVFCYLASECTKTDFDINRFRYYKARF